MRKLLGLLLVCLTVISLKIQAQDKDFPISLHGKVYGEDIRKVPPYDVITTPLPQAYIQIKELPKRGWLTDSTGYFKIDDLKSKKYHINFSFIGLTSHDTIVIPRNEADSLHIILPLLYKHIKKYYFSSELSRKNIKRGFPNLVMIIAKNQEQQIYENPFWTKYGVTYTYYTKELVQDGKQLLGAPNYIISDHNEEVFNYLDKNFGTAWRKEAPKGIFGLDKTLDEQIR